MYEKFFRKILIPIDSKICWNCKHWNRNGQFPTGWCYVSSQVTIIGFDCEKFNQKKEKIDDHKR